MTASSFSQSVWMTTVSYTHLVHSFLPDVVEQFDNIWQEGMHVRLAGIGMSDFDHQGGIQTDLFCDCLLYTSRCV